MFMNAHLAKFKGLDDFTANKPIGALMMARQAVRNLNVQSVPSYSGRVLGWMRSWTVENGAEKKKKKTLFPRSGMATILSVMRRLGRQWRIRRATILLKTQQFEPSRMECDCWWRPWTCTSWQEGATSQRDAQQRSWRRLRYAKINR